MVGWGCDASTSLMRVTGSSILSFLPPSICPSFEIPSFMHLPSLNFFLFLFIHFILFIPFCLFFLSFHLLSTPIPFLLLLISNFPFKIFFSTFLFSFFLFLPLHPSFFPFFFFLPLPHSHLLSSFHLSFYQICTKDLLCPTFWMWESKKRRRIENLVLGSYYPPILKVKFGFCLRNLIKKLGGFSLYLKSMCMIMVWLRHWPKGIQEVHFEGWQMGVGAQREKGSHSPE